MRILWMLPIVFLTGCLTAEEKMANDDAQCQSYGVAKDSPAYVECRMKLARTVPTSRLPSGLETVVA